MAVLDARIAQSMHMHRFWSGFKIAGYMYDHFQQNNSWIFSPPLLSIFVPDFQSCGHRTYSCVFIVRFMKSCHWSGRCGLASKARRSVRHPSMHTIFPSLQNMRLRTNQTFLSKQFLQLPSFGKLICPMKALRYS